MAKKTKTKQPERTHEQLAEDIMMAAVELNSLLQEASDRPETHALFQIHPKQGRTAGQVEVRVYRLTRQTPVVMQWEVHQKGSVKPAASDTEPAA